MHKHHRKIAQELSPLLMAMHPGRGRWNDDFAGLGFGPGGPFGPHHGPHRRHGGRARRGNVRNAILHALAEAPMNGYQIIGFIEQKTEGQWRPSPGAIYPALSQLEDEQMIQPTDVDGNKAFSLTAAGEETVLGHGDRPKPWDFATEESACPPDFRALLTESGQLAMALQAAGKSGNPTVIKLATDIVSTARRDLYRLLADSEAEDAE